MLVNFLCEFKTYFLTHFQRKITCYITFVMHIATRRKNYKFIDSNNNMKRGSYLIILFVVWILLVVLIGLLEQHSMLPNTRPRKLDTNKSLYSIKDMKSNRKKSKWKLNGDSPVNFEHFDNYTGNPDGCYIVPNIVHFIRFNTGPVTFTEMICYLAALKNQKPDHLLIHYDLASVKFTGKYWESLMNDTDFSATVRLIPFKKPEKIFSHTLDGKWKDDHASDYMRLEILMAFGGIFIDNDIYLLRPLDNYRRYEFVINSERGFVDNRVIIAHRDARLLPLWVDTYDESFRPDDRLYNKIFLPSQVAFRNTHMIHLTKKALKVPNLDFIYNPNVCWKTWCDWPYVLYTKYSDYMKWSWTIYFPNINRTKMSFPKYSEWNEKSILLFNNAFRDMVLHVYNPYNISLLYHCHNYY